VPACKRLAFLTLAALAAAPAAGSEGMRILTFVPGVVQGRLPVTVDLGASPPPADLLLDGKSACRVTERRQTCTVDLGARPRVALLELVRRGASGRDVERVRRWVNKPSTARAEVLPRTDCTKASGPCTLSVAWAHESALDPTRLSVSVDGRKTYEGPVRDVPIPFAAERPVRVVSVDLAFVDGQRVSETLLVGSGTSSAVEAPLNAIVVTAAGDAKDSTSAPIATLGGRRVHSVESGESEALLVVAPSAVPKLLALEAASQKAFSKTDARLGKLLPGITRILHFSPLATRGAFRSATGVSDRLFRLQGFDCTPGSGHRDLVLPCVDPSVLSGDQYRLAATVASAAFARAATPRRRVAVLVLGDEEARPDESPYGAADARRYLSEILFPLEVWRVGRVAGGAWGDGRRVSTPQEFVDAWAAVRAELDAQRLCWVAEDLDPAAFRLASSDTGLALAGRGLSVASSAPLAVTTAPEPEQTVAVAAVPTPRPDVAPPRKSIAASQEVGLLNLDAFVTDGKGRRIRGLKASDFTLRVAGRSVAVTNFSEFAPDPAAVTPAAGDSPPPAPPVASDRPKRRVVIFVDRLTLGDKTRSARFFGSLRDFVVRTIGPGDLVSVLSFDETLATRVPFTDDTFAVLAALDTLAKESARPQSIFTGTENAERLVAEIEQAERDMANREGRSSGGFVVPGPPTQAQAPVQTPIPATVAAEARTLAAQEWGRTQRKATALRAILSALGGLDGRRVLVVASHRLSRWSGMEYFLTKRLDVDVQVPMESREFDARNILLELAQTANAYGVTLHGLYPENGGDFDPSVVQRSVPQFTGQPMTGRRGIWIDANESDGLHLAVDDTGGSVGLGAEAAGDLLAGAAEDLESFYSLGFPAEGLAEGKPLQVDLKVAVPGATVRTRRAVLQRTAAERAIDRTVANLFGSGTPPGLPVQARVTSAAPAGKGRVQVTYEVVILASHLALLPAPGGRLARISASVAVLDTGEVTLAEPVRREFRTGEDSSADATSHFTFTSGAVVGGGSTISIGILDEATLEAGFARLDVPSLR
jgi:VWFA-related protein